MVSLQHESSNWFLISKCATWRILTIFIYNSASLYRFHALGKLTDPGPTNAYFFLYLTDNS